MPPDQPTISLEFDQHHRPDEAAYFPLGNRAFMSNQSIQSSLESSLIGNGGFSDDLFEEVIVDFRESLHDSLHTDADDALICVVADGDDVALLLIEWDDSESRNGVALARMKQMWKDNFIVNMRRLIPVCAEHLEHRNLGVVGIKWVEEPSA